MRYVPAEFETEVLSDPSKALAAEKAARRRAAILQSASEAEASNFDSNGSRGGEDVPGKRPKDYA